MKPRKVEVLDLQSAWGMRQAAGSSVLSRVFTMETAEDQYRRPAGRRAKPVDDIGESFVIDDGRRKSIAELAQLCGFRKINSRDRASLAFEGELWG